jgi:outer membrane protein assembly factor BamB
VQLGQQLLWQPLEADSGQVISTVDLEGRADLIVMVPKEGRLRRLDGATGKPAWLSDFVLDARNLPTGRDLQEWTRFLAPNQEYASLVEPPPDLDGDGTRDLIVASRTSPSLLAISGKDGHVLWSFRGRPAPAGAPGKLHPRDAAAGAVVGEPALVDVNGDGTPDVVVCFASSGETFTTETGQEVRTGPQAWVEAVSGKTGTSLWRHSVDTRWLDPRYVVGGPSTGQPNYHRSCRPEVLRIGTQLVVVMAAGPMLLGLDPKTGAEVWPPHNLGFHAVRRPHFIALDRDRQAVALCLRSDQTPTGELKLTLVAVSCMTGQIVWESWIRSTVNQPDELDRSIRDLYLTTNLAGDGRTNVLIPIADDEPSNQWSMGSVRWCGLALLDGTTGQPIWQRRLWLSRVARPTYIDRFLAGPDLNGDGARDVFAAWIGIASDLKQPCLTVAALSGRDGRTLWRWRQAVNATGSPIDPSGPLRWGQVGPDGWPQLLVPVMNGPGGQHVTYILSAGTGRLVHTLPEVFDPKVADFNGDGIPDLFYTVAPQGAPRYLAIRGTVPEPWRELGSWQPIGDLDGDGTSDLVRWDQGAERSARSGADHRLLWQTQAGQQVGNTLIAPPLPLGDLDADGIPDLLGIERETSGRAYVSAISGKDGRRLWTASGMEIVGSGGGMGRGWAYSYPALDCYDFDGDGRAEILVAHNGKFRIPRLAVLSGRDGNVLWEVPLLDGGIDPSGHALSTSLRDLNGDGVADLVLWAPREQNAPGDPICDLQAFSGRDGTPLWSSPALTTSAANLLWRQPVVGDLEGDGVPEVVVVLHHGYDAKQQSYACEVVVLDGRSGRRKWSWSWELGDFVILPPLLVDFEGNGHRSVCLGVGGKNANQATTVVLDSDAHFRARVPLTVPTVRLDSLGPCWRYADLAGNGKEELLFATEGRLRASRAGGLAPLWEWTLPGEPARIVDIQPAHGKADATVIVWAGRGVYGLAGATGRPRWHCDVPEPPPTSASQGPNVRLLTTNDPQGLPRVLFAWPNQAPYSWTTVCRQAWPTDERGRYQPPASAPLPINGVEEEWSRPLPWAEHASVGSIDWLVLYLFAVMLAYAVWRRHWRRLVWLLIWTLVTAGVYVGLLVRPGAWSLEPGEHFSWEGWYIPLLWGVQLPVVLLILVTCGRVSRQTLLSLYHQWVSSHRHLRDQGKAPFLR